MVHNGSDIRPAPTGQTPSKEPPLAESRREFLLAALDTYEIRLTAYANRLLQGDLDRARDVVQHAFLQLCQQSVTEVRPKLAAWLYTVVRNRIVDEARSARSSNQTLDFDCCDTKNDDPAEQVQRVEFLRKLRRLMMELPDSQREVIDLWSHGFSSTEISEITGTTQGTVRVAIHRGLKTLKQHPRVARWLAQETQSGSSESSGSVKPSRATGFSAKPVDPGPESSATTSVEPKTGQSMNGNSRVSMPGRLL